MIKKLLVIVVGAAVVACSAPPIVKNTQAHTQTLTVCVEHSKHADCDFYGNDAIQRAVDSVETGGTIIVRAGRYQPKAYRDVALAHLTIRGFTVIEDKALTLRGEGDVVLEGRLGAACAFVAKNSHVVFKNIRLNDFRWGIKEDDTYDGHGIFVIGGRVRIHDVSMQEIQKMALSIHSNAHVEAVGLSVTDSHLGVWANGSSTVKISDSLFYRSESAGLAAYDQSQVFVQNSVFEVNQDDGVFASDNAKVALDGVIAVGNKPYDINVDKQGNIQIDKSFVAANEAGMHVTGGQATLTIGKSMLAKDPR